MDDSALGRYVRGFTFKKARFSKKEEQVLVPMQVLAAIHETEFALRKAQEAEIALKTAHRCEIHSMTARLDTKDHKIVELEAMLKDAGMNEATLKTALEHKADIIAAREIKKDRQIAELESALKKNGMIIKELCGHQSTIDNIAAASFRKDDKISKLEEKLKAARENETRLEAICERESNKDVLIDKLRKALRNAFDNGTIQNTASKIAQLENDLQAALNNISSLKDAHEKDKTRINGRTAKIIKLKEELKTARANKTRTERKEVNRAAELEKELQAARTDKESADKKATAVIAQLEEELKSVRDDKAQAERKASAKIAELQTNCNNANTRIAELQTDCNNANTRIAELQTDCNNANTRIAELQTDCNNANTRIAELQTDCNNANTRIAELQTDCNNANTRIAELQTDCSHATLRISELQTNCNHAGARIANLEMELITARNVVDVQTAGQMNELVTTNNALTAQNAELRTELENANSNVRDLNNSCATMRTRIDEEVARAQQLENVLEGNSNAGTVSMADFMEQQERANKAEAEVKELTEKLQLYQWRSIVSKNKGKKVTAKAQQLQSQVQFLQDLERIRNESFDVANTYLESLIHSQGNDQTTTQADMSNSVGQNTAPLLPVLFNEAMPMHFATDGAAGANVQNVETFIPANSNDAAVSSQFSADDLAKLPPGVAALLQANFSGDTPQLAAISGTANGTAATLGPSFSINSDGPVPIQPGTWSVLGGISTGFNALSNTPYGITTTLQPGVGDFTGGLVQRVEPRLAANFGSEVAPQLDTSLHASGSAQSVEPLRPVNLDMEMAPQPGEDNCDDNASGRKRRIAS